MTHLACIVVSVAASESPGMGADFCTACGAMAAQADFPAGMAALARLEISPCFRCMLACPHEGLGVATPQMRPDPHGRPRETAVAGVAERLLIVAAVALLRIVQSFDGMNIDEIAAVAFGFVIPPEIG